VSALPRPATDTDELALRLWNTLAELAQREDELQAAMAALGAARRAAIQAAGQDLRRRFPDALSGRLVERPDGTRELVPAPPSPGSSCPSPR
jgi:hypothetical protein